MTMPFHDVLGQQHAIETLQRGLGRGRLHHALLFYGPDGVGKELTALALACAIVCTAAPGQGCGSCSACHRALSGESEGSGVPLHPDVVIVERGLYPKEVLGRTTDEKTDISVDQIRRVVLERIALTPHEAPQRIVIIRRAEEMNDAAANALLKTLEEPPSHTRFVLVSSRPGELLPTIRSRTQPLRFAALSDAIVEQILRGRGVDAARAHEVAPFAGGSVEVALALSDPDAARERAAAVDALRAARRGPLIKLLEVSAGYANSGDDRRRLSRHVGAVRAAEATELRRLVMAGRDGAELDAVLATYDSAIEVAEALVQNANVPLALEAAWRGRLRVPRRD